MQFNPFYPDDKNLPAILVSVSLRLLHTVFILWFMGTKIGINITNQNN